MPLQGVQERFNRLSQTFSARGFHEADSGGVPRNIDYHYDDPGGL